MKSDKKIAGLKAKVHRNARSGAAQRIYTFKEAIRSTDPRATAKKFLKQFAVDLGIQGGLKNLVFDKVKTSLLGKHVLFQQHKDGKPISSAWLRVDIGPDGKVFNVQNDLVLQAEVEKAAKKAESRKGINQAAARKFALAAVKAKEKRIASIERVFWPVNGKPVDAWKVIVRSNGPIGQWRIYLDAVTGRTIAKRNMIKHAVGRVFDPTPVAKLNNVRIEPVGKLTDDAYAEVSLLGLNGSGFLDGEHVTTKLTKKRVKCTDGDFRFHRTDRAFREVMVYYHIDTAARHLKAIGFGDVFGKPIEVKVDGTRQDNSWYDPEDGTLTFGTGGVDDSEDAEIILHEYGHAIQDAQVPGWGWSDESAAMGEGFGDYFAANFFFDKKPKRMQGTVFNWDFFEISEKDPPHGRRLTTRHKYPPERKMEVHDFGEVWSACLWELREKLGADRAERLVIAHHYLLSKNSTFSDAAHALLTANERLYKDKNRRTIRALFERRGIIERK